MKIAKKLHQKVVSNCASVIFVMKTKRMFIHGK